MPTGQDANLRFLRRAIALATENVRAGHGGPFAAVVVRDGRILGEGVNTLTAANDPTAHAEVNAIRAAATALGDFSLAGCEIYSSCEPCPMCLAACYWARLGAIYFAATAADAAHAGFDDDYIHDEFAKPVDARSLPAINLLREEAWASFQAWIEAGKKIPY